MNFIENGFAALVHFTISLLFFQVFFLYFTHCFKHNSLVKHSKIYYYHYYYYYYSGSFKGGEFFGSWICEGVDRDNLLEIQECVLRIVRRTFLFCKEFRTLCTWMHSVLLCWHVTQDLLRLHSGITALINGG